MKLLLKRIYTCSTYNSNGVNTSGYTISHLYIDGSYVCDAIEDTDRGLDQSMSLSDIINKKVKGETAIPTGTYKIQMTYSPKFANRKWCAKYGNKVPQIMDIKGWSGVRIHPSNYATDVEGCIAPGYNKQKGCVLNSTECYYKIMDHYIIPATKIGIPITIDIIRTY